MCLKMQFICLRALVYMSRHIIHMPLGTIHVWDTIRISLNTIFTGMGCNSCILGRNLCLWTQFVRFRTSFANSMEPNLYFTTYIGFI